MEMEVSSTVDVLVEFRKCSDFILQPVVAHAMTDSRVDSAVKT